MPGAASPKVTRGEDTVRVPSPRSRARGPIARGARRRGHPAPAVVTSAATRATLSDEHLVAQLRRGERDAFDVLATRYHTPLLWFCWQILRSKEDAEDALQDVYAAAFNALLADAREIHVRPWLYRIARNRCINQLRRAAPLGCDSMDDQPAEGGGTVVEQLVSRQQFRELVADVQELPDTQRTALLLREIDGFSYQQIAGAMETSVPAVKSLLVRARAGLLGLADARERTPAASDAQTSQQRKRERPHHAARAVSYQAAWAAASAAA